MPADIAPFAFTTITFEPLIFFSIFLQKEEEIKGYNVSKFEYDLSTLTITPPYGLKIGTGYSYVTFTSLFCTYIIVLSI